jgi:hypothetical protein
LRQSISAPHPTAAAKADTESRPVIAALKRCSAQNHVLHKSQEGRTPWNPTLAQRTREGWGHPLLFSFDKIKGKVKIQIKIQIKIKDSGQECPLHTILFGD